MATLTGQTVASTYDLLLKVKDTGGITSDLRTIQDGDATDTALDLSTAAVRVDGTLTVNGVSTLTGAVTAPAGVTGALTGNADTATTATNVTVADTTDATCFVGLFESATGNLPPKSDAGLTYAADTGTLTATALVGPLTGNVAGNLTGGVTGNVTGNVTGYVTGDIKAADGNVAFNSGATIAASSLGDGVTATTQSEGTNDTTVATTAFVETDVATHAALRPSSSVYGHPKIYVTDTTLYIVTT